MSRAASGKGAGTQHVGIACRCGGVSMGSAANCERAGTQHVASRCWPARGLRSGCAPRLLVAWRSPPPSPAPLSTRIGTARVFGLGSCGFGCPLFRPCNTCNVCARKAARAKGKGAPRARAKVVCGLLLASNGRSVGVSSHPVHMLNSAGACRRPESAGSRNRAFNHRASLATFQPRACLGHGQAPPSTLSSAPSDLTPSALAMSTSAAGGGPGPGPAGTFKSAQLPVKQPTVALAVLAGGALGQHRSDGQTACSFPYNAALLLCRAARSLPSLPSTLCSGRCLRSLGLARQGRQEAGAHPENGGEGEIIASVAGHCTACCRAAAWRCNLPNIPPPIPWQEWQEAEQARMRREPFESNPSKHCFMNPHRQAVQGCAANQAAELPCPRPLILKPGAGTTSRPASTSSSTERTTLVGSAVERMAWRAIIARC